MIDRKKPGVAFWATVGLVALLLHISKSIADMPSGKSSAIAANWPTSLTATVGDVLVRIDGPKLWTLSRIEHAGALLGIEDSAYGTVVNIRDVGFIGTAHKEVEPEQVTDIKFFVDGRLLESFTDQMQVHGKNFRLSRESKIRSLHLQSELQVADDQILQSVRITSDTAVDLKVMYPFMYAWTPTATNFAFGSDDGEELAGELLREKTEKPRYIIEKTARWAAVYEPASQQGTISCIVGMPHKVEGWLMLADAPEVYRKLYLVCFSEEKLPSGFDGTFKMVTGFFSAEQDRWKDAARKKAEKFKNLSGD